MIRAMTRGAVLVGLAWLTLLHSHSAHATVLREVGLAELVREADHVVVSRVLEKRSRWEGKRIVTDVVLSVSETAKGPLAAGERLVVTVMGGSVGGIGMKVIGEARFRVGEEALLFLAARGPKRAEVVAMAQGRMPIAIDPVSGARNVRVDLAGASVLVPDATGKLKVAKVGRAARGPRPLGDVLAEVRALVTP